MRFNKLYGLLIALFVVLIVGVVAMYFDPVVVGPPPIGPPPMPANDPGHFASEMDYSQPIEDDVLIEGLLHVKSDNGKAYEYQGAVLAAHAGTRCNCDDDENEHDCDELPTESVGVTCYDWYWQPPAQPLSAEYKVVADPEPSNLLTVTDDGKVGIGTTNPTMKLDVNGNVNIKGDIHALDNIYGNFPGITLTQRFDLSSTDWQDKRLQMVPLVNTFCFLVKAWPFDTDWSEADSGCNIYESGGYYWLQAFTDREANLRCSAQCLIIPGLTKQ